jgi:DNA-binding MarR family transcriptional regulator
MDRKLREQFVRAMFRARKVNTDFPQVSNINMSEFFVMENIAANDSDSENNINVSQIQCSLYISKAAVSQILSSLENKGYVVRETDKTNRRKITVTLTATGKKVLEEAKNSAEQNIDKIIARFGEEKMSQLLSLFEELVDVTDGIKQETVQKE